ncbi:MAG: 50S ribosomal protein L13 [Lentimicrobiaceae bacterium]|jgi:large subunit ribosomal protein L13|nr:50S ribosomal protein L13 [Lentimicrobiaceae bacterium]
MNTLSYKTLSATPAIIQKEWYIVDAENQVLGRLASKVANILKGKNKTYYTPNLDCGDNVIIINAEKVILSGNKLTDKEYIHHTGYPGGQRIATPKELFVKKPTAVVEMAIKGMLPKNRLGRAIAKNVKVYAGTEHKHEAQQPKPLNLNSIK